MAAGLDAVVGRAVAAQPAALLEPGDGTADGRLGQPHCRLHHQPGWLATVRAWRSPGFPRQGGTAIQVTVTVQDVAGSPNDVGPISLMPSFLNCPLAAEQPLLASKAKSHAQSAVSWVASACPLAAVHASYWRTPGFPPGPVQWRPRALQGSHGVPLSAGTALEVLTSMFDGTPVLSIVIGNVPLAPRVPTEHSPLG
jgi:hypothetical protein